MSSQTPYPVARIIDEGDNILLAVFRRLTGAGKTNAMLYLPYRLSFNRKDMP
jgi:hypothetical protein